MKNKEEKILKRDIRLVKNEKSWRRARVGAICLSIIHILSLIIIFKEEPLLLQEESKEALVSIVAWVIFWLLIVSWLNLRLGHIDSIKLYRNEK